MVWKSLFGERATTKIAACFDTEQQMSTVAQALRNRARLQPGQVKIISPGEDGFGRKLEPEGGGIVRTAFKSHIILGLSGLVAGAVAWFLVYLLGIPAILSSPGLSVGAFLFFGAIAGLLLGGLITARPDHQLVIQRVRTAAEEGRWSLVIHPRNPRQHDDTLQILSDAGVEPVRTL